MYGYCWKDARLCNSRKTKLKEDLEEDWEVVEVKAKKEKYEKHLFLQAICETINQRLYKITLGLKSLKFKFLNHKQATMLLKM